MSRYEQSGLGCLLLLLIVLGIAFLPYSLLLLPIVLPLFMSTGRNGGRLSFWESTSQDQTGYQDSRTAQGRSSYGYARGGAQHDPILELLAAMMKADGHIMRSELEYVKGVLLQLYRSQASEALLELRDILKEPIQVSRACIAIRVRFSIEDRMRILKILYELAQADGNIHSRERDLLDQIARELGLDAREYSDRRQSYAKQQPDYYAVLGISSAATDSEVRTAYRRLAQQWHPDRYVGKGERAIAEATERFKQINEAYDSICKLRGMK